MLEDPIDVLSLAEDNLRQLLADCGHWWDWCGVTNRDDALSRIHLTALPAPAAGGEYGKEELIAHRPFLLIYTDPQEGLVLDFEAEGGGPEYSHSGGLTVEIEVNVAAGETFAESERVFKNHVGQLLGDLEQLAGRGGRFAFDRLVVSGPMRTLPEHEVARGAAHVYVFDISWDESGQ